MDPVQNPFSPGAGTPPPELAGRGELLEEARIMIGRTLNGRSTQGMLMTGLRGVGKTVILNELMRMTEEQGVLPLYVEATAESTLSELLASELKKLFFTLNRIAGAADKVKKGLVVLRNFIGTIHLNVGDTGLDIEPFAGIADSGNIEAGPPVRDEGGRCGCRAEHACPTGLRLGCHRGGAAWHQFTRTDASPLWWHQNGYVSALVLTVQVRIW